MACQLSNLRNRSDILKYSSGERFNGVTRRQCLERTSPMPHSTRSPITSPLVRTVAIAALMSAAMLATPLTAARADSATNAPVQLAQAQSPAAKGATQGEGATVEQRITDLHTALKITPDQEALWKGVAVDMRENAAAMDKLIAATKATPPKTAVDDLKTYQNFTQAHLDGLKNLLSHFEGLYAAMPDAQKKVADDVFQSTRNPPAAPNK
jgi:periplasmic protein CpxP/Spy